MGGIRTVSEGRGSQLLVGSTRNCILIGSLSMGFSPAILGHTDELWALCPHPTLGQFLTAGFDRIVQLWDSLSHSVVWSKDISVSIVSVVRLSDLVRAIVLNYDNTSMDHCTRPSYNTGTSAVGRFLQRRSYNNRRLRVRQMDGNEFGNPGNLLHSH